MKSRDHLRKASWAVWMVVPWLLAGCGSGEHAGIHVPKTTKQAATQIQQAFSGADATAKQNSDRLSKALRERKYQQAYDSLGALRQQKAQNVGQVIAVENAYRRLQADVLQAKEQGDPNAIRVWNEIKRTHRD